MRGTDIDDAGGQQDGAGRNNTAGAMRDETVIGFFKVLMMPLMIRAP